MMVLQSSPYVPEFTDAHKTVQIPFRQRWIEPVLHPVTLPFEPWIKTRIVNIRERTWFYMGHKIVCHPNNVQFVKDACGGGSF